jgi:hypothetical protein
MWARGGSHLGHDDWVVSCGACPSTDISTTFSIGRGRRNVPGTKIKAWYYIVPGTQSSFRGFGVATVEE